MTTPSVSVIIPTYRRFSQLLSTIRDVLQQDYAPMEVLVVDQNREWPEGFHADRCQIEADTRVRWLVLDRPGVVMARNLAAAKSQGEILLFLDDDVVIPNRKFISRHVANYRDAKISSVTGRELHADQAETDAVPADGALPGRPSEEDTPLWSTKPAVFHALFFDRNSALRYEVATFCTCNGSIRRSEFLRVGGFDENFSGNSYGDDYDLAVRLSEAHGKLVYDPQAALIHLQAPLGGLRLKDPRNTFSEKDKALSACLFFLRHSRKGCRWHLLYHHLFRKTVLLRRNLTHFWSQPLIWCGITAAWLEARRRLRHGPISCFRVAAP